LGKIHPPCITSTTAPVAVERYRPSLGGRRFSAQVPNWESLKVIALDKFHVNSNLSSGNQFPQIVIRQPFTPQILLHKVNISPYLRLVE
jgi:hypothetical protein